MKEGRTRNENQVTRDLVLVLLIFLGAYLFSQHDWGSGKNFDTAETTPALIPAYDTPSNTNNAKVFTLTINGLSYQKSSSISPTAPIMAYFQHPNPAVTKIKMQHPRNERLFLYFPLNREVHIQNHSDYMLRSQYSSSKFLAVDEHDRVYDEILIEFVP